MTPLWWLIGGSLGSWLAVTAGAAAAGFRVNPELLLGMAGPLVSATATWIAVVRAFASSPARVTGVMMAGFAVKMVFFGAYVVVALRVLGLQPVPFMVSFTSYFIALHLLEALFLRRLFADVRAADGGPDGAA